MKKLIVEGEPWIKQQQKRTVQDISYKHTLPVLGNNIETAILYTKQ